MGLGRLVELRWGASFANVLTIELPLDNPSAFSRPRAGYEARQFGSGVEDAWVPGFDAIVEGDVRAIPTVDLPVSGWAQFFRDLPIATPPTGTGGTAMTLGAGQGANLPAIGAPFFLAGVLSEGVTREAVNVTARAGDVLTITRGQYGTAAGTFTAAARFLALPQAGAATGWDGAAGWDAFLRFAWAKNVVRFYPDRITAPTTFRDVYLTAPTETVETRELNYTRRVRLGLRAADGVAFTGF